MSSHSLDGVTAAPKHHAVLFENSEVRVIRTVVPVGDITPLHTHPKTVSYVLSGSDLVRRDDGGSVLLDTREDDAGFQVASVRWSEGTPPHTVENLGPDDLVLIGVELKS